MPTIALLGGFARGGFALGGFALGGFAPGGFAPGGFALGGGAELAYACDFRIGTPVRASWPRPVRPGGDRKAR